MLFLSVLFLFDFNRLFCRLAEWFMGSTKLRNIHTQWIDVCKLITEMKTGNTAFVVVKNFM